MRKVSSTKKLWQGLKGCSVLLLLVTACSNGREIDAYLQGLTPDPSTLNVRDTGTRDRKNEIVGAPETKTEDIPGKGNYTCTRTTYNLEQNFDEIAILRPTQGIVWPGALVKGNQSLTDGVPEPITLPRSPVTISIDLPGIGANGTRVVENPSNSSVQTAVNEALEWWNANAYQEGYVNAASSSFQWTSSHASEQTGLAVGLNLAWASGEVSAALSETSSQTKQVITGVFKQAFYTVTYDTPASPAEVFANGTKLAAVEGQIDRDASGAYIANVTYGRIVMVRMETTASESAETIEGAFNYSAGLQQASGAIAANYEQILKNSTFTVITLGGNAAVATEALTDPVDSYQGMLSVIQGDNAIYSRSNPGVPISYTVRYLSDNSLARLGATTDYTTTDCALNNAAVTVTYEGIKVLGDCRLFEGNFHWTLRAGPSGSLVDLSYRPKANALQGDDVVGTYFTLDASHTFTLPKAPGSALVLDSDIYESLTDTHFPNFKRTLRYEDNWGISRGSSISVKKELNPGGAVGISACNVRLDYKIAVN